MVTSNRIIFITPDLWIESHVIDQGLVGVGSTKSANFNLVKPGNIMAMYDMISRDQPNNNNILAFIQTTGNARIDALPVSLTELRSRIRNNDAGLATSVTHFITLIIKK